MWPRVVELMLGCWLVISPFVFRHDPGATALRANDMITGALVAIFALASFAERFRHAHLLTGVVALWLIAFGYMNSTGPHAGAVQNHVAVGILLVMFAIIPNEINIPPRPWRGIRPDV